MYTFLDIWKIFTTKSVKRNLSHSRSFCKEAQGHAEKLIARGTRSQFTPARGGPIDCLFVHDECEPRRRHREPANCGDENWLRQKKAQSDPGPDRTWRDYPILTEALRSTSLLPTSHNQFLRIGCCWVREGGTSFTCHLTAVAAAAVDFVQQKHSGSWWSGGSSAPPLLLILAPILVYNCGDRGMVN